MLLLSVSISVAQARAMSGHKRTVWVTVIGVSLYFLDQIVNNIGLLWNLNPYLTASLGTCVVGIVAVYRLRRVLAE